MVSEKTNAHSGDINSVAFSPDGKTIVSGSDNKTLKVWDVANPRPYNAAEWEEVDISAIPKNRYDHVKIEGLGFTKSNYWRNTVTGDKQNEKPSGAGEHVVGTVKVWDAGER